MSLLLEFSLVRKQSDRIAYFKCYSKFWLRYIYWMHNYRCLPADIGRHPKLMTVTINQQNLKQTDKFTYQLSLG